MPESWSTGEAVAEITTSIDDLNRKLDVYSEHVFRQARWEAELVASDLRLADVPPLAERSVQSAESLGRLSTGSRRASSGWRPSPRRRRLSSPRSGRPRSTAWAREPTRMIAFLQQERVVALKQVTDERIAAINTITQAVSEERTRSSATSSASGSSWWTTQLASGPAPCRSPGLPRCRDGGDPRPRSGSSS